MKKRSIKAALTLAALAGLAVTTPVAATSVAVSVFAVQSQQREDQGEARKEMKAGNQLSLREIEKRILPKMKGAEYLGPVYDAAAHAYRLKFIKNGHVMYLDVDARTGKIINRSR